MKVAGCLQGVKEFVFKEDPANLAKSRQNLNKMYWVEKGIQVIIGSLLQATSIQLSCVTV
jgi:hypothetical protein